MPTTSRRASTSVRPHPAAGTWAAARAAAAVSVAAMQMIPKPIELTPPQVQQTRVRPDIQPGQGANMSLAQSIMQFLQG
jgi:hypothetical protein